MFSLSFRGFGRRIFPSETIPFSGLALLSLTAGVTILMPMGEEPSLLRTAGTGLRTVGIGAGMGLGICFK